MATDTIQLDDDSPVEEAEATVRTEDELRVTENGQVDSFFPGAVNVPQLDLKRFRELAADREIFLQKNNGAKLNSKIKSLIGVREPLEETAVQEVARLVHDDYHIEKRVIHRPGEVPMPAALFVPNKANDKMPATLVVDGRGKHLDEDVNGSTGKTLE